MIHIQTVPAGSTLVGMRAGSISAVLEYKDGTSLDNAVFVDANIATIEMPSDTPGIDLGQLVGSYLTTPLTAGVKPASTFTDYAAFNAARTAVPAPALGYVRGLYNNGTNWIWRNIIAKKVLTLTITTPGTGYVAATGLGVLSTNGDGEGLTIDVTTVGSSGDVTAVALGNAGIGYQVGDTITLAGGNNDCVITIASNATVT